MDKANFWITVSLSGALFACVSCDKNEQAYNRLIDSGRWQVMELSAGTTVFTKLPKWQIHSCADHTGYCGATWEHQAGSISSFYWRFTNFGGKFEFFADNGQSDTSTMAYSQCTNFSGTYLVVKNKRNYLELHSEETLGYPGKMVTLILEREK